ncbi:MAG: ABC transporter substrate-binding protein, partial [Gemmatimonadales bacterium]
MRRILLACTILLPACGEGPSPRTLTYYFTAEPRGLDPALSTDVPTGEVVAMVFDNLTQFDPEGGLGPGLATRWEPDSTGAVWTFHLRPGATFHDGGAVTAERIRASLLRALAPGTTGGRSWPLHPIRGARAYADGKTQDVEGLRIVDDSTLQFVLE